MFALGDDILLKEDDPLLYRSLDAKRTFLCLDACRRQRKYTEVFDLAISTDYRVAN